MRYRPCTVILLLSVGMTAWCGSARAVQRDDSSEKIRNAVVYLEASSYAYEQSQPWKHAGLTDNWACGCAVDETTVVTTAHSVANLAYVKALRHGQNEFIPAKLLVVDYESNLCLIRLDPNALAEPLEPLSFSGQYEKGAPLTCHWLSENNRLFTSRAYLDRADVQQTRTSFSQCLRYVAANTSRRTGRGELYFVGDRPIGIACWSSGEEEVGLIPGEAINRFLKAAKEETYKGFGALGFATTELLDPAMRAFLKMPSSLKDGVYVADVHTLGTGSDTIRTGDVLLAIDDRPVGPYGRFEDPRYERLSFHHLITSRPVGEKVSFQVWRDAEKLDLQAEVSSFRAADMLIPYHEHDLQPEYVVTGGFVLQKLTRPYMARMGDNWEGSISPHLYHYYIDHAFKPSDERSDVVVLSYVLPAPINLGYKGLGQIVVEKFNGMSVRSIHDILAAQKLNPDSKYDVIEFELDTPQVVIPRDQLAAMDQAIASNYGIPKLVNVRE